MKISVAWLCDHLKPYVSQRIVKTEIVQRMVELLERSSIEIDAVEEIIIDLDNMVLAYPQYRDDQAWIMRDDEHEQEYKLVARTDYIPQAWYLLMRGEDGCFDYATYLHVGGLREGYVPPLAINKSESRGAWKQHCDLVDYRVTIDNKAITHRPDMWSHRGIAREIAALLVCDIVPLSDMIAQHPVVQVEDVHHPLIKTSVCDYFARLLISPVLIRTSPPWLALRLLRIDSKPMNLFVDATNYVMFDIGQPLHVFDADAVQGNIHARQAYPEEELMVLDGKKLSLRAEDCVIADEQCAISLAGIMGGKGSGFRDQTHAIMIESAHFDPISIRASATAHHMRTEASSRFEKDLDPALVVPAAQRYSYLLQEEGIAIAQDAHIAVSGVLPQLRTITIAHEFIERKIGALIPSEKVIKLLHALGIMTRVAQNNPHVYDVDIPSWRMRDLNIREDLVEEIARMIGYDALEPRLPMRSMQAALFQRTSRLRLLKHHLAYGWRMQEVHNYALYDEQFLRDTELAIYDTIPLKNPVSEQWQRLATSLIPHLLKNIAQNIPEHEEVRLFEVNETWRIDSCDERAPYRAQTTLSFIWYTHKKTINFYEGMRVIQSIGDLMHIPLQVHTWDADHREKQPWCDSVQYAYFTTPAGTVVGAGGMMHHDLLARVAEGTAFIAELDAHILTNSTTAPVHYQAVSKFPRVVQDISLMVPYKRCSADSLMRHINALDARIVDVALIDFFEKESWKDARSLTFRIIISDHTKTLMRSEIDDIMERVRTYAVEQGAIVR